MFFYCLTRIRAGFAAHSQQFTCDALGRLQTIADGWGNFTRYSVDANGNRVGESRVGVVQNDTIDSASNRLLRICSAEGGDKGRHYIYGADRF